MKSFLPLFCIMCVFISGAAAQEAHYPAYAVMNAAYVGDVETLRLILETDFDIDYRDLLGGTALHVAIFQHNMEVIRMLLESGFDVNAISAYNGFTPLHYCVWTNNIDAARLLVEYHADRTIKSNNGQTAQEKAAREGKRDILLVLNQR